MAITVAVGYLVFKNTFAATQGWIFVNMHTPNGGNVQGGGVIVSSVDANNNNMTTYCDGQAGTNTGYNISTNSGGYGAAVCQVSSGTTTTKRYRFMQIYVPAGYVLDSNQINITGSWVDWNTGQFDLVNNNSVSFNLVAIPSGCGSGTQNNQCASIDSFTAAPNPVPYGGTATFSWGSTNAGRCNIVWGGNGSGWQPADGLFRVGPITQTYNYVLTCEPGAGGATPTRNLSLPVTAAPTVNASANQNIAYNAKTTISWSSANTTSCNITTGTGAPGAGQGLPTSGSWTSPNLTSGTTYVVNCNNSAGYTVSKTLGITVGGKPPVIPDGCGAGTKNNQCNTNKTVSTSTGSKTAARANTATAPGDSQRPTTPGNLKAEQMGTGEVKLSWDASTDNNGISAYIVERSTDGTNWQTLSDGVTDTNYTDDSAAYKTKYTYRVSAKDTSGNYSDYVLTDILTTDFQANAFKDKDNTITSDDGVVSVKIPAGALPEDAMCSISTDDPSGGTAGKSGKLLAGPYTLICKLKNGDTVEKFNQNVEITISLSADAAKSNAKLFLFDGNNWANSKLKFNSQAPNFTYVTDTPQTFAVLAVSGFNWAMWLFILLVIAAIIAGVIWFLKRRSDSGGSGSSYNDYLSTSSPGTIPGAPASSGSSAVDSMPTPGAPAPGSTPPAADSSDPTQTPGHHQIIPTPHYNPTNHHSPLDRLAEEEKVDGGQPPGA